MAAELPPDFGPPLQRNSPVPLWAQTEQRIVRLIREGRLGPGQRLDPQPVLCRRLAVSRSTLRQALGGLRRRGVVIIGPGRGAYVADDVREHLDELTHYQPERHQ